MGAVVTTTGAVGCGLTTGGSRRLACNFFGRGSTLIAAATTFATGCRRALRDRFADIRVLFFGHAGDGNLHIAADEPLPGQDDATHELCAIVYDLVRKAGGRFRPNTASAR